MPGTYKNDVTAALALDGNLNFTDRNQRHIIRSTGFKASRNRFTNVFERFLLVLALGNAPRNSRALGHAHAGLVLF